MPLKLLPFKEFIINEYQSGKSCQKIADENGWYQQAVANLLKHFGLYDSYLPNQGNIRYFQTIDSPTKAYFLGFIAADGCLQNNGNNSYGLTITIHNKDREILDKLREEIGCENTVKSLNKKDHCRFQLFNREMYQDLLSYGLTERKSTTMPDLLPNIPEQFRKAFIIGYFDGDGSASYNKASKQLLISFRGTEEFLQGIVNELQPSKYRIGKEPAKDSYQLTFWRKGDLYSFYNNFKELNFYLKRKSEKISSFLKINTDQTISPTWYTSY